jgi:hypothetical protein
MIVEIRFWLFLSLLALIQTNSFAQACCSGGTPITGSLNLQSLRAQSGFLDLQYDFNTQSDLVSGSELLNNNPRTRNTHSVLIRSGISPWKRWTLSGLFSLIRQEERTNRIGGGEDVKIAEGIGDMLLLLQYELMDKEYFGWLLASGIEIPIGKTDVNDEKLKLPLHPDLQPGRGALAYLFASSVQFRRIWSPTSSFFLNLSYRISRLSDRYEGLQKYRFGNECRVISGVSEQLNIGRIIIEPAVSFMYRRTEQDEVNGFDSPNTGGHWLHLRTGLSIPIHPRFTISGFWETPVYRDLHNTQLTTSTLIRIMFRYNYLWNQNQIQNPTSL